MNEAIVVDEGRVVRDAIHVERDSGELQVEGIVVPLVIADLRQTAQGGSAKGRRRRDTGKRQMLPHLLQLPEEFHRPCTFQQRPVEESNPAAVHGQRVMRVAILCQGQAQGVTRPLRLGAASHQRPEAHGSLHNWHAAPPAHSGLGCSQESDTWRIWVPKEGPLPRSRSGTREVSPPWGQSLLTG